MAATRKKTNTNAESAWIYTYDAQAVENSDVIVTTPCSILDIFATNKAASGVLYVQLFDAAAVPANTAVPSIAPIAVPAGTTVRLSLNDVSGRGYDGIAFTNGIAWAASTTAGTLTVDTTNSVWVTARYLA